MSEYLSRRKRDVLIDHLDGRLVVIRNKHAAVLKGVEATEWERNRVSTKSLVGDGYLEEVGDIHTQITQKGREALAELLADHAEALIQAGWDAEAVPRTPAIWLHLIERKIKSSFRPGPDTAMSTLSSAAGST
jgi:hypothetical protein